MFQQDKGTTPEKQSTQSFIDSVELLTLNYIKLNSNFKLFEIYKYINQRPGKRIRSQIIFHLGQQLNLDFDKLKYWAASCELLHNATLIHDDIQDGDLTRRLQPTVWNQFGLNHAINMGDYLMLIAPKVILDSSIDNTIKLEWMRTYSNMSVKLVKGQTLEFELINHLNNPQLENLYFNCIEQKTSALIEGIIAGVLGLTTYNSMTKQHLVTKFKKVGSIFQIQDDIIDLFGNKKREELGCDIKEGKVSSLIIQLLKNLSEDKIRNKVISILKQDRDSTSTKDIDFIKKLILDKSILSKLSEQVNQFHRQINQVPDHNNEHKLNHVINNYLDKIIEPISHLSEFRNIGQRCTH